MAVLEPLFSVLDETDSGLDIDALKSVSEAVNKCRKPDNSFPSYHSLPATIGLYCS